MFAILLSMVTLVLDLDDAERLGVILAAVLCSLCSEPALQQVLLESLQALMSAQHQLAQHQLTANAIPPETNTNDEDAPLTPQAYMNRYRKHDLQQMCAARGVGTTGTKRELAERLLQ